jgi:hypothetical protein
MGLGQQAYVDAVLSEEMIQFLLKAADAVSIAAGQLQGQVRASIFGYEEYYDLEHSP